jgi:hypothetical protein
MTMYNKSIKVLGKLCRKEGYWHQVEPWQRQQLGRREGTLHPGTQPNNATSAKGEKPVTRGVAEFFYKAARQQY